jgi:hypothetical protein
VTLHDESYIWKPHDAQGGKTDKTVRRSTLSASTRSAAIIGSLVEHAADSFVLGVGQQPEWPLSWLQSTSMLSMQCPRHVAQWIRVWRNARLDEFLYHHTAIVPSTYHLESSRSLPTCCTGGLTTLNLRDEQQRRILAARA